MTTDINTRVTTNLNREIRLSQQPVPSDRPASNTTQSSQNTPNADNIVPLGRPERQNIAAEAPSQTRTRQAGQQTPARSTPATDNALNDISRAVQSIQRNLEFRIDEASGRTVITVKDTRSQEVIRQIPSEQLLELSARLQEIESQRLNNADIDAQGILFTSKT